MDSVGLTGTKAQIDEVTKMFGVDYHIMPAPESAAKYAVMHSTTVFVLDRDGRIRGTLSYDAVDDVVNSARSAMKNPAG